MNSFISGKYFLLEKDNRLPLTLPTGEWQNLSNKSFNCPVTNNIYIISGNNNLYIGSDSNGNRIYSHKNAFINDYHRNSHMQNTVKKYGIAILYYTPLVEIPNEYIIFQNEIENSYIKLFDTYNNGYNLCEFANSPNVGKKLSLEHRQKLSLAKIGYKPWNTGLKGTHYSRKTEFTKGIIPWNKGKTNVYSESTKINMGLCNRKKVICIETGTIYSSANEASKSLGLKYNYVKSACNGHVKTVSGFHWRYI